MHRRAFVRLVGGGVVAAAAAPLAGCDSGAGANTSGSSDGASAGRVGSIGAMYRRPRRPVATLHRDSESGLLGRR